MVLSNDQDRIGGLLTYKTLSLELSNEATCFVQFTEENGKQDDCQRKYELQNGTHCRISHDNNESQPRLCSLMQNNKR